MPHRIEGVWPTVRDDDWCGEWKILLRRPAVLPGASAEGGTARPPLPAIATVRAHGLEENAPSSRAPADADCAMAAD